MMVTTCTSAASVSLFMVRWLSACITTAPGTHFGPMGPPWMLVSFRR